MPGKRRRAKKPLRPAGRNPYVVATRRLGHKVRPSLKGYARKGRMPQDEREES